MTDLDKVANYLSMKIDIVSDSEFITVHQSIYIQTILKCFYMKNCMSAVILMQSSQKLMTYNELLDEECLIWYRLMIKSLMWFITQTRPDITYAVEVVAYYVSNFNNNHKKAVLIMLHYF